MALEQTTTAPEAPAEVSNTDAFDSALDAKLAKIGIIQPADDAPAAEQTQAKTATADVPEGELSPDDIAEPQGDAPPPDTDFLEVERKGEIRKLSKEDAKRFAQMGLDYSINQEALKAEKQATEQMKAALIAQSNITPAIVDAAATVKAFDRQLAQYQNVDWAELARQDVSSYAQHRAQFDQLQNGRNQALGQLQQAAQAGSQISATISAAELQQEFTKVVQAAPELRDAKRYESEAGRIRSYLSEMGLKPPEIDGLADARYLLIARDAMRYRQAIKAKAERDTTKPIPTLKPGAPAQKQTQADKTREITQQLHQAKDPARKKGLLDKALEAKLSRFF